MKTTNNGAQTMTAPKTIDIGNSETLSRGVFAQHDGTFLALTYTESKTFKTRAGAERWYTRKTNR